MEQKIYAWGSAEFFPQSARVGIMLIVNPFYLSINGVNFLLFNFDGRGVYS